ncbi:peroxiredoxin family protein [Arenibacter lacus]|uniref:peroxiredoxin family protein n=1 Tax=Arenibacter lacus TaxID=2608629 RepID=UPI00123D92F1|nr:TlpA family protein disulfide reductase [Arenibacter lacus]
MEGKERESARIVTAKELEVNQWVDAAGKPTAPILLSDYPEVFKVIYCFQYWCKGCHSRGFPSLKRMINEKRDQKNILFLAIQTVFEGHKENTYDNMIKTQKEYGLAIPFGHDPGDESTHSISKVMTNYRTGGTPWIILINEENRVVFSDFI